MKVPVNSLITYHGLAQENGESASNLLVKIEGMDEVLLHERTLLGAIDSYCTSLAHVRPHLAKRFEWVLEEMAERWLAEERTNRVDAVESLWLQQYLAQTTDGNIAEQVIRDFYRWAYNNRLTEQNPLTNQATTSDRVD